MYVNSSDVRSPPLLPADLDALTLFGSLFDPTIWADPYPLYAELRERGSVLKIDEHLWAVSSHSTVQGLLRSSTTSSDERNGLLASDEPAESFPDAIRDLFLFMDPPDHTRLRSLVVRAFTPRQVKAIEPRATAIVDGLLDAALERGEFDVAGDLGHPLALQIICELLGVPFEDRQRFSEWGDVLARLLDPGALRTAEQDAVAKDAAEQLGDYLSDLIDVRRAAPGSDLLSELIAAEEDGDRLREDELVSVCLLLLVAGFETTVNLVSNGFVALMEHRDAFRQLCDQPALLGSAVNEMLRYDSPVQMTVRVAMADLDLDGVTIPNGSSVIAFLAAANRDPLVFEQPTKFDIGRSTNPHLAFGNGIHHCLGAALARTEAQAAFLGLARRMPDVELVEAVRRPTFTLRGHTKVTATTNC